MATPEQFYEDWFREWRLSNPEPKPPPRDNILYILQFSVVIGAVLLSGTRTGNVVSNIGTFADFGSRLGYLGLGRGLFITIEAILAFVTFDAAILLAGYLMGEDDSNDNWFTALFLVGLIPAMLANLAPGLLAINNSDLTQATTVVVDVVVGLSTPIMAYVAGRSLASIRRKRNESVIGLVGEWKTKANIDWSNYWRRNRKSLLGIAPKPKEKKEAAVDKRDQMGVKEEILRLLNDSASTVSTVKTLAQKLSLDSSLVGDLVDELQEMGYVVVTRTGVRRTDF